MARAKKQPKPAVATVEEPTTRAEALVALGLAGEVSDDDVRTAFRTRLKAAHPDIHGGTDALLRRLILARELLMSDSKSAHEHTELLTNFGPRVDDPIRLDISLAQAIDGGETLKDVPALEVSAAHEALTSLTQMKTLRVPLPAGLRNGDLLRVPTEGVRAEQVFRVHIEAPDGIRVWGGDLWMTAYVEARIFAIGGLARIETPHGPRDVAIEKDAPRGSSLCLPGLGLPATDKSAAGNLHVRLEAMMNRVPSYKEALSEFRLKWAS
ncbi:DnaJ C-terminal domain-containing protein [Asticcacaulis sp. AC402]|uniref:DnaJ C-terminal domain-containing protein n=1 Tax=Asticcacaulis sp. AC402 TaxID=1282361 RepID=UPI0003C40ECE|nr:DnaJ C-terminal domain-containing protein [Asticcacaulis sp. AC402]ESQ74450.1 hypothetical protein ABAC402_14120 [Asticcacaulis sp. AC402]